MSDVNNAFVILETLRFNKNKIQSKTLRFLGITDYQQDNAIALLEQNGYKITNEGGYLELNKVPLLNLSLIPCSYSKDLKIEDLFCKKNEKQLNEYFEKFKEPRFIYNYRKWHGISYKKMRELMQREKKLIEIGKE